MEHEKWYQTAGDLQDYLHNALAMDIYTADYGRILDAMEVVETARKDRLLELCAQSLHVDVLQEAEAIRVMLARTLVALLPQSLDVILQCLQEQSCSPWEEMHFSLFCYLDWVNEMPVSGAVRRTVLEAVSEYLMLSTSDEARASWMAGDLLGSHWDYRETYAVLSRLALEAKSPSGRAAALYGMEQILDEQTPMLSVRNHLLQTARQVARLDNDKEIREQAKQIATKHAISTP